MKAVFLSYILAHAFWFVLFSPWGGVAAGEINFWLMMAIAAGTLAGWSLCAGGAELRRMLRFGMKWLLPGIVSAVVLYAVFLAAHHASGYIFDFTKDQVARVYELRQQAPTAVIAVLLVFIAPAEEVFWRGLIQRRLAVRLGPWAGWIFASLMYAAVHVWALNLTLFAAALMCGLFWGWIMLRYRSLWPCIISHVVWDLVIFVFLPIH